MRVVIPVVAVLCSVAVVFVMLFAASPAGVFLSLVQENPDDPPVTGFLKTVMRNIFGFFMQLITDLLNQEHDELEVNYQNLDNWKDVLIVYAVRLTTDITAPYTVAMLESVQQDKLQEIYMETHPISSGLVTVEDTDDDETEEKSSTKTVLSIVSVGETLDQMMDRYAFSDSQRALAQSLQSEEFDDAWDDLLYGDGEYDEGLGGDTTEGSRVAAIALSQVGTYRGTTYWKWYGFEEWQDWCGCFASWCMDKAGYGEAAGNPKFAAVNSGGIKWFQDHNRWRPREYTPSPGDLIFINRKGDGGQADHVEIVTSVAGGVVHTVGGNRSTSDGYGVVKEGSFLQRSPQIVGYGIPRY